MHYFQKNMCLLAAVSLLCLVFLTSGLQPSDTRINENIVRLNSFKLKPLALKKYKQQNKRVETVRVNKNGVVTPAAGYKMIADRDNKLITVIDADDPYVASVVLGVEAIPAGPFTIWCHCGGDRGDNCEFDPHDQGGRHVMECGGSCDCGVAITVGKTPPWHQVVDEINLY